jgi:hypothetical protein
MLALATDERAAGTQVARLLGGWLRALPAGAAVVRPDMAERVTRRSLFRYWRTLGVATTVGTLPAVARAVLTRTASNIWAGRLCSRVSSRRRRWRHYRDS